MKRTAPATKARKVDLEYARLIAVFDKLPQGRFEYAEKQIKQLAWYNVSIAELHIAIDKAGTSLEYNNGGGQYGTHANPDINTLVSYQKLANSICGNLLKLFDELPPELPRGSKLEEFLTSSN